VARTHIRITYRPTGTVLAAGPLGWGITPFEGNYYVRRRHVRTDRLRSSLIPGFCIYKFLYVWLDLALERGRKVRGIGWMYWLANPLLPFLWFRVGLPGFHPDIQVERFPEPERRSREARARSRESHHR
jgi:hypothetical protein